jgi:membrane protein
MELVTKSLTTRFKDFGTKVSNDNLFLFSSSISYYSALALAPFILIILWMASLLGQNIRVQIIEYAQVNFSEEVAGTLKLIFSNIQEGVTIGSVSGIIGLVVLLWTCSLVFLQFRHAFDVIYGYFNPHFQMSTWETIKERLFAMLVVLGAALLLIVSFTVAAIAEYVVGREAEGMWPYRYLVIIFNFLVYLVLFSVIHYFTPSKRQSLQNVVKIAALTSVFFILGNILLAYYLKGFAGGSVYGAAGTLLVFLVWAYYSAFTIFLSVEVFQFFKKSPKGTAYLSD